MIPKKKYRKTWSSFYSVNAVMALFLLSLTSLLALANSAFSNEGNNRAEHGKKVYAFDPESLGSEVNYTKAPLIVSAGSIDLKPVVYFEVNDDKLVSARLNYYDLPDAELATRELIRRYEDFELKSQRSPNGTVFRSESQMWSAIMTKGDRSVTLLFIRMRK